MNSTLEIILRQMNKRVLSGKICLWLNCSTKLKTSRVTKKRTQLKRLTSTNQSNCRIFKLKTTFSNSSGTTLKLIANHQNLMLYGIFLFKKDFTIEVKTRPALP